MAASSTSSSAAAGEKKYDVFISFRGEDTRQTFTAHLRDALCRSSINVYTDDVLKKGDEISPALIQAIENSSGSLVVFSENYASSRWCLNELAKILERRIQGHFVIPVFYKINPSEVRNHKASYGEALAKHEQLVKNKDMMGKWKAALVEAANIAGWDSQSRNHRDDSELILNIVKDVSQKLDHIYEPYKLGLVGIDRRCEHIEALLQEFPVVGIWGMGGIGKTTLARAVFDKLSSQYDSCCFLENIREESQRRGANQLRVELLQELLKDDVISINLHKAEGLKHARRRLSNKKVFIVLDDVNNFEQLEHLGQECKSLGPKSRVVITTRDKHLLTSLTTKHEIYEVKRLDVEESLELFRSKAFNEKFPERGFEEMIKKIVSYTQGNPLALKILGLFLLSKTREEWESEWKKLKKIPNEEIGKVLKLSFDELSYENKQIFLDIACFLRGEDKEKVISLLDSFGFYGATGIRTLQDRALITLSCQNVVQMHDLIQEMGQEIIRKQSIQEPGGRSRLWDPKEVGDVLKNNKGTQKVEGISLDMSQIKDLDLSVKTFKKMINLRYLDLYFSNFKESNKIHIPVNAQLFSNKLSYLRWDRCPLQSLSSNFCAEKLVALKMPNCNVKKLWNGVQDLKNLKSLDLSGSKQLKKLPNFSKASSLKSVQLSDCTNLRHIHPSILRLHRLENLDVSRCIKLESLRSEVHLESLKYLNFMDCSNLREFSLSSENIRNLSIKGTVVEIIHSSIGLCKNLENLILRDSLKNISSDLSRLTSLKSLIIYGCMELDTLNLHIMPQSSLSLTEIILVDCLNLSQLPKDINYLSHLTFLYLRNCERLWYIPELPDSIERVCLINCTSLETIMTPKLVEYKRSHYFLANCVKLDEDSLSSIVELTYFKIKQAAIGAPTEIDKSYIGGNFTYNYIFFPGNRVPSWFRYRAAQNLISIEIPPRSHLLGFAFYCILSPEFLPHRGKYLGGCGCVCHLEINQSMFSKINRFYLYINDQYDTELMSDHMCVWFDREDCDTLFNELKTKKAKGQRTLSFEFFVNAREKTDYGKKTVRIDNAIKECGVWPLYTSEYDISIKDLELREDIKLGYRTDDIDEQVEPQFDELTGFTRYMFDLRDHDISPQTARQDLIEISSLCSLNRFNELDYSTSQMELNLELGFGNKSKRCQDIDDHQTFQIKKSSRCQDICELLGGASTSGIGVGCSEFVPQLLTQTNTMNEFIFEHPPTDISMQNTLPDPTQMNPTHWLDRFGEFDNSISQFGQTGFYLDLNEMPTGGNSLDIHQQSSSLSLQLNQGHPQLNPFDIGNNSGLYASSSFAGLPDIVQPAQVFGLNLNSISELDSNITQFDQSGFCPDLNEMPMGGNSLDTDQQSLNLSLRLNQGHPQMNPFDVGANSGLYASLSSSNLLEIVQMAQADDVFGSSFCSKQEDPQMNLMKGIEVGGSHQENQHEQDGISCSCFIRYETFFYNNKLQVER